MLTAQVQQDIGEFLIANFAEFQRDAIEYDGLDLTVAVNENGTQWNYQTGDNSFTGGAYGLPHWAVITIDADSDMRDIAEDIFCQLEELIDER